MIPGGNWFRISSSIKHLELISILDGERRKSTKNPYRWWGTVDRRHGSCDYRSRDQIRELSTVLEEIQSTLGVGKHPNRTGNEHRIYKSRPNNEGFNRNRARNQSLKQVWGHDDFVSSDEEGDEQGYEEFDVGLEDRNPRHRNVDQRNVRQQGYGEREGYRVKAEIPNFVENLDIEAVLDWLYEVDKFFDIMDVPEEEQVKIMTYKLRGGAGAW